MEKSQSSPEMDAAMQGLQVKLAELGMKTPEQVADLAESALFETAVKTRVALRERLTPDQVAKLEEKKEDLAVLRECVKRVRGSIRSDKHEIALSLEQLQGLNELYDGVLEVTVMSKLDLNTHSPFTFSRALVTSDDQDVELHSDGNIVWILT